MGFVYENNCLFVAAHLITGCRQLKINQAIYLFIKERFVESERTIILNCFLLSYYKKLHLQLHSVQICYVLQGLLCSLKLQVLGS